jgi:DNA-binding beta-propeller fold protein YncE
MTSLWIAATNTSRALSIVALLTSLVSGCAHSDVVNFEASTTTTTIHHSALYPETIVYNPKTNTFLVGSFREGAIFEVDSAGATRRLVSDQRLNSVLGIAIDAQRQRLWAVNADLGGSLRPSAAGPKTVAALGIYDLSTGAALEYIDLAALVPGSHLANGIALDTKGTAYVTDSFSPVIYKVEPDGHASVFLRDERFSGAGINLNGVVVHPDGYLLVVKKSDGALFKVPLANPKAVTKVNVARSIEGGDGLLLVGTQSLVVIANQTPTVASNAAFALSSEDGWVSAKITGIQPLGAVYPTTAALRGDRIFVVHSKLAELIQAPPELKAGLHTEATIREIGRVR